MISLAFVVLALALLLFRLFDIFKPWPIRKLEALPNGTGIMLDDVAAGLLALLTGLLLSYLAADILYVVADPRITYE